MGAHRNVTILRAGDPGALEEAARAVREGRLVAFPTETFYGLAADPRGGKGIGGIIEAKGRETDRPLPLIADSLRTVADLFSGAPRALELLALSFWPGPLTLAMRAPAGLHRAVIAPNGTTAVRVPGSATARELARLCGGIITATSANRSGRPPAAEAGAVSGLGGTADILILDGGRAPGGLPSTVLDLSGPRPRMVRTGAVPVEAIEAVVGAVAIA